MFDGVFDAALVEFVVGGDDYCYCVSFVVFGVDCDGCLVCVGLVDLVCFAWFFLVHVGFVSGCGLCLNWYCSSPSPEEGYLVFWVMMFISCQIWISVWVSRREHPSQ